MKWGYFFLPLNLTLAIYLVTIEYIDEQKARKVTEVTVRIDGKLVVNIETGTQ